MIPKNCYRNFSFKPFPALVSLIALVWASVSTIPSAASASGFTWVPVDEIADGSWTDSERWSAEPGRYPGSEGTEGTALINLDWGSPFTVTLNTNPVLESFTLDSAQAILLANAPTFGVGENGLLQAGRAEWINSTWNGGDGSKHSQ